MLDAAFTQLIKRLDTSTVDERGKIEARDDCNRVEAVCSSFEWTPRPSVGYAVLLACAGQEEEAAQVWKALRRLDSDAPQALWPSLATAIPFPDNLPYLQKLGDFDRIIRESRAAGGAKIPARLVVDIASNLRDAKDLDRLDEFALTLPGTKAFIVFEGASLDDLKQSSRAKELAAKIVTRFAEAGDLQAFLACVLRQPIADLGKEKRTWLGDVVGSQAGLHQKAIRALAAARIDRESLEMSARDGIERYFEGLIHSKNADLQTVSPFEAGAVLELSSKYRLMQNYYELLLKARPDRVVTKFAQERLVGALVRLAAISVEPKARQRAEEQYKRLARESSIDPTQLPTAINLHGYQQAIDRFYGESSHTDVSQHRKAPTQPSDLPARNDSATATVSERGDDVAKPKANAGETFGQRESSGDEAEVKGGAQQAGAIDSPKVGAEHRVSADSVNICTGDITLELHCDYGVRRIEMRNAATRETAVLKMKGIDFVAASTDVDVTRNELGDYLFAGWPVKCQVASKEDGSISVSLQIIDGGPIVEFKI